MDKIKFDKDENFIVRESKFFNYFSGFIFVAFFFGILVTRDFERGNRIGEFYFIYIFILILAAFFFVKGTRNSTNIVINKIGIYYKGTLISKWENFINAFIRQEEYQVGTNSDGINDNFKIIIEYFDPNLGENFVYSIPTSSTQDKSEYEIISAISYFSGKNLTYDLY
jgi:hypothetical protein